jgi:hypothetical protein
VRFCKDAACADFSSTNWVGVRSRVYDTGLHMDDTEGEEVKEGGCYIHVDCFLHRSCYVTSVSDTVVPFSSIL